MLTLTTLASGSSGNCALVSDGTTHVLIDAGISARRITTALKALGIAPQSLSGVLVTHEHTDHISGLATLTKQLDMPLYASGGTARAMGRKLPLPEGRVRTFRPGETFSIGALEVETFPTPHDAAESTGYAISAGGRKAAVVTDLGYVTAAVAQGIRGAHLLLAEANYEPEWLQCGPYPAYVKARIQGERGHLSNRAGAELACLGAEAGAATVVLAHLSRENNTPQRAYDIVRGALERRGSVIGQDVRLEVAPRDCTGTTYTV